MSDGKLFTVPPPGSGMPGMSERINKLYRSLMRHRERYIRAWIAHYGAHPSQVHIVMFPKTAAEFGDERGDIMRLEYRKDTDDVAELVKAAQDAERTHARYELETLTDCAAMAMSDAIVQLRAALKPFERQKP